MLPDFSRDSHVAILVFGAVLWAWSCGLSCGSGFDETTSQSTKHDETCAKWLVIAAMASINSSPP